MAYQYKGYEESDGVKKYRERLEQMQQQKPGEYQSQWQQTQKQAADALLNRKKFQYNMSADPLYQQYKEQYQRQGKLAMQDTMGQAAAMNGGYGSSYAQMAGQQAYNGQLQQLHDKVPQLYQLALEKYQMEGQEAMNRFNLAGQMESQDYGRYRDQLSDWQAERDYATGRYDTERNTDYNMWADRDEREYGRYQDEQSLARAQVDYLISIGVEPNAELMEAAGYNGQYVSSALEQAKKAASYGGGGSSSGSGKKTAAEIAASYMKSGALGSEVRDAMEKLGFAGNNLNQIMSEATAIANGRKSTVQDHTGMGKATGNTITEIANKLREKFK